MPQGLLKIGLGDFGKGLLLSVIMAILLYLQTLMGQTGFTFSTISWPLVLNIGITTIIAYLIKNLGTSQQGNIGGVGDIPSE